MPFEARVTTTPTPWSQVEAAAMAYAARLDALLAVLDARAVYLPADELLEEALHAVGTLLGGLGHRGFAHDLRRHLDILEEEMLGEAGDYDGDYGPRNPYARLSDRLSDAIDAAREADSASWLQDAQAIVERLAQPAAVAA